MRDSSLDEFLSGPDEESEGEETSTNEGETVDDPGTEHAEPEPDDEIGSESGPDTDEADESEERPPPTAEVEPARSTYAWSPEGAACAACGERVEERWESADGLVCIGCKEW